MVDRMIPHHFEILGLVPRWRIRIVRVEGVHHADSLDRFLRYAIDYGRRRYAGRLQDCRDDIDDVVELVANATLVFNHSRPRDRHALAYTAKMRRDLLGP